MDFFSQLINHRIIPFLKKWTLLPVILGAVDIFSIGVAFQIAYYINYLSTGGFFFSVKYMLFLFLAILPLWLLALYFIKIAEIPRTKRYRVLFFEYLQSALVVFIILLVLYFVFRLSWISRRFLIEFVVLGFLFLFLARFLEYKIFKTYRAKGYNFINLVLYADDSSIQFIERLRSYPEWGYRIVLILSSSESLIEKYRGIFAILPNKSKEVLEKLMEVDTIDEILYIKSMINPSEVRQTIRSCEEFGITFRLLTKDQQPKLTNAFISIIASEKFLTFINIPYKPFSLAIKKFMDFALSVILLIILSPIMLIIGVLIWSTSKGPIIYKQLRIGLRGRQFNLYKFRTMVADAEIGRHELESLNEMDGPVFKIKNDPRVTKFGRFLRRTGLDELPQLINVLKGEMSLIGPRPPLQEETKHYKRWQLRRLSVKPGLSCFWQIKPDRNNIKFEKWMELDLAYIDNWSPRLDFLIFLKTIKTVFQRTGV
jgi:exopolysaccharide biosynthesis polyprenyl glycosylphosphotransferase